MVTRAMEVSVILCTYSEDRYEAFSDAAESILAQTYEPIELVVVVDSNQEVYERAKEEFDNDRVVIQNNSENVGNLESINTGVKFASGDIIANIDDDATADERWIEELVSVYEDRDVLAVGGRIEPDWVAGKAEYIPEEFYWLIGATHRGFQENAGEVRNTFGSNLSFKREIFQELGGFRTEIGDDDRNRKLQGGETELCARLYEEYEERVYYNPDAVVFHKIFDYRTKRTWLVKRAFWQGVSKRGMEVLVPAASGEEWGFLSRLVFDFVPSRLKRLFRQPSFTKADQFVMLFILTVAVGFGYLYGMTQW
jgi:glycosyltransferase involved in cell wall biosynthesis